MYAIGASYQNSYCKPTRTFAFDFDRKVNSNTISTAHHRQLHSNTYDNRIEITQFGRFVTSANVNINVTTHDGRMETIESSYHRGITDNTHSMHEQKYSPSDHFDSSVSMGASVGSSMSRLHDDVMSIDTFPCVPVPLTAEDKIVNWLDIPLVISCIHTNRSIDDEEISLSDDFLMDTTARDGSRMTVQRFTPNRNMFHVQGQWHFDIESADDDEISMHTVETWSLSEDFS